MPGLLDDLLPEWKVIRQNEWNIKTAAFLDPRVRGRILIVKK